MLPNMTEFSSYLYILIYLLFIALTFISESTIASALVLLSKFCCQDTLRTAPSALKKLVAALVPALGDKAVSNLVLHHVFEPAASLIAIKSGCLDCGISQLLRWLIASRSQLCKRSEFHLAERGAVSASQVAKDLTREPIEVDGNLCRSVSINFSLLFPLSSSNK